MSLSLTLLGTGVPSLRLRRAGSSYLVSLGDERILFDCGPFSMHRLLETQVLPTAITSLFLTHLHYDHCADYGHLVLSRWDEGADDLPDLNVYGPAPTSRMTGLLFGEDGVYGPDIASRSQHPDRKRPQPSVMEVHGGSVVETDNWRVQVAEVVHCQPELTCLAYRLDSAEGSIVFGGDTAPTAALTRLAQGADILLHMCHFLNGEEASERLTSICSGHLDASRTAQEAGVRTLALVHITAELDGPGMQDRIFREVGEIFEGRVILGEDLMGVSIEPIEHVGNNDVDGLAFNVWRTPEGR